MTEIRSAQPSDLPFILTLERSNADLGLVGSDSAELHARRMESTDASYFVIEHAGQAAGYVVLCGLDSESRNLELKRVVVSTPGEGIGRQALRQVMARAFNQLTAHRLWLDVYDDNVRARKAYKALGFVEEGIQRECVRQGSRFRSLVLMSMLEREFRALDRP
jgi:diamine N-acetyltransferase